MYSSGKFVIFPQNLTWVEKLMENREKFTESNELIFRFLRLHFQVENAILKLKTSKLNTFNYFTILKIRFSESASNSLSNDVCPEFFRILTKIGPREPIRKQING